MHPTSADLVDTLGRAVLRMVVDNGQPIRNVAIYDPAEPPIATQGTLLLAPGVAPAEQPALLRGHSAVVFRASVPVSETLLRTSAEHQVAVLELAAGVEWTRIADDARAVIAAWSTDPSTADGPPAGDLFSTLDAAAALLDAPVILEDTRLAVLAWSDRQDEADEERVTSILDRQAPGWLVDTLEARGVFARLAASDEPAFVEPASAQAKPRMATAVRAGGDLLGYLWATSAEPFDAQRCNDFARIAKAVARLLRTEPVARRADLVAALLHGRDTRRAAAILGIAAPSLTVLAARSTGPGDEFRTDRRRILDPLTLHLSISHAQAVTTFLEGTAYALLPWPTPADALTGTKRLAEDFLRRVGHGHEFVVAVGLANSLDEVSTAKEEADLVLRVLLENPKTPTVAAFADVQSAYILSELARVLRHAGRQLDGPVDQLAAHDLEQHTDLLPTLSAYLDFFGDVKRAADRLHVHPNTFRNRLNRIQELTGFHATDPDARFLAELQLRLRASSQSNDAG
ncbi:PucR family transcriptional regulator [Kibdelosporangium aridum]|uniref:DNA-binding transcriptional regulator, PucR family n=1 Tax=Kibdelosporangium aridum TaxID=2030 RepID=A0A1W2FWR5_KIBAR|nr:helix-turn-helix domain-containing protein [Kibdelosporangium aridum]SMD26355.1 DNA-binding transcriptional regulator, PucR family [Kibdelosporangium aridum]